MMYPEMQEQNKNPKMKAYLPVNSLAMIPLKKDNYFYEIR
jgi:hypothetical protein